MYGLSRGAHVIICSHITSDFFSDLILNITLDLMTRLHKWICGWERALERHYRQYQHSLFSRQNTITDNRKFRKQSNCRITTKGVQTLDLAIRGIDGEKQESSRSSRWVDDSQIEWFMVARWMNSRCQRAKSYVEGKLDGQQTYAPSQTGMLLNIILLVKFSGWIWPKYVYTAVAGLLRNSIIMLHWWFY